MYLLPHCSCRVMEKQRDQSMDTYKQRQVNENDVDIGNGRANIYYCTLCNQYICYWAIQLGYDSPLLCKSAE